MTRNEFKIALSAAVDEVIETDRELSDSDEDALNDQFGDVAQSIFEGFADEKEDGDATE